jgi:hypothetical protein
MQKSALLKARPKHPSALLYGRQAGDRKVARPRRAEFNQHLTDDGLLVSPGPRHNRTPMDGLSRRLRALSGRTFSDRGIVARYFPKYVRGRHEIVIDDVGERCARCAVLLGRAYRVLHVWKLRSGIEARWPLLTLCDRCDGHLRPRAYLHVTQAFR